MKSARRIVHYHYGKPQEVLQLESSPSELSIQPGQVRVRLTRSMIHPADLQLISAQYSLNHEDIPGGRVPGMEGVGIVEEAAEGALHGTGIEIGMRVAFIADSTW